MKKNILIADDSALLRRVMRDIIEEDGTYTVSDMCRNGLEAYELIKTKKYDAVILDIVMPKMTGLELLERLKKEGIKATVIVASTLTTSSNSAETLRALELDAVDFIAKPTNLIEARGEDFRSSLLNILNSVLASKDNDKIVFPENAVTRSATHNLKEAVRNVKEEQIAAKKKMSEHLGSKAEKKLVALACSTGGPKALNVLMPMLSANLDAPVLIVQHMPEGFTKLLSEKLNNISKITVKEAEHGEIIKKGHVYIAPGGKHMMLTKAEGNNHRIKISDEPPRDALKPCADIMYESLNTCNFDEITCVVLTGMGSDGTKGINQLCKNKNVYVISQDAQSCVVYGMPKAIYESGIVDEVVPLENVASAITRNVGVK